MDLLFEIKPVRQMELFHQELKTIQRAGYEGREALRVALELAGRKVRSSTPKKKAVHSQLKWNFGKSGLPGQRYFDLGGGEKEDES